MSARTRAGTAAVAAAAARLAAAEQLADTMKRDALSFGFAGFKSGRETQARASGRR
jgi:hypothetical protein